jgi:enolase
VRDFASVTAVANAVAVAQSAGWRTIVSHPSGGAEDAFVAEMAVGMGVSQIKAGAPCAPGRRLCGYSTWLCKFNQLLRIEMELGGEWEPGLLRKLH